MKKTIRAILYIALIYPISVSASKQAPYIFTNLTTLNGLKSNVTNSIVQDKYGFIWIGTQEGLSRYDGYKMLTFHSEGNSASISSDNISTLLYDDDYIWIGTWNGLSRINIKTFEIEQINTGDSKVIRTLFKDSSGKIWIGTASGILIYNKNLNSTIFYNTSNSSITHNTIRSFYETKNGTIWIGTYDGLNKYEDNAFTGFNLKGSQKPLLENNLICTIHAYSDDNDSILWIGTETGLVKFDATTGKHIQFNSDNTLLSNEVIKCIYQQDDSILWLGTDFGLNILNINTRKVHSYYHDPLINHTIANNVIWEIFEDQQKRLWLITSGGVSIVNHKTPDYVMHEAYYSYSEPRIGNQIKSMLIDDDQNLWMATIHGVIKKSAITGKESYFTTTSQSRKRILLDNVYALAQDKFKRIWIGTAGGINIWDSETQVMKAITANKQNGLTSNYISGFAITDDGTIWVSAWEGGLYKIIGDNRNLDKIQFLKIEDNGEGRFLASGNRIYMSIANLFWEIDTKTLQKKSIKIINKELQFKSVSAQAATSDGAIWIGSENKLLKYQPEENSIHIISISTGAPEKIINIREDASGYIWATTHNTLIRVDPNSNTYLTMPVNTNTFFKGFYNYSNSATQKNTLYFGGDNGYIEVNPDAINVTRESPEVYISELYINNQPKLPTDSVHISKVDIPFVNYLNLKSFQNSITFEFTTLDYLFPEVSQYKYRLHPHEESWTYTSGEKNFAVFSNLRPGSYQLEVRGTNRLGSWSETKLMTFHISPPLLLSKGFIILYLLLIIALTYLIFNIYNFRQKLKNEMNILRLESKHSELIYNTKINFFTNISHEFRTPLSLILPPIQQMLKNPSTPVQEKMLQLAFRNAQRLYKLVSQLLDLRKIETAEINLSPAPTNMVQLVEEVYHFFTDVSSRNEIDYTIIKPHDPVFSLVDREKIEIVLFNLLSNAFKYTPFGGKISIEIQKVNHQVEVKISDTGSGISENDQLYIFKQFYQTTDSSKHIKTGSGIGLTLANEYVKMHKGTLTVNSDVEEGSTFTLTLTTCNSPKESSYTQEIESKKIEINESQSLFHTPPASSKRILIIDDNEDILDFIKWNLQSEFHLITARDGEEGWKIIKEKNPNLVISDVMMPIMDGIELCAKIKEDKRTAHLPVILLTAKSMDQQKVEGMQSGADMYITKPFDIDYLRSCIDAIFKRDRQLSEFIKSQIILTPPTLENNEKNPDEQFLAEVMSIIENNLSDPNLTVEYIATETNMSATHLYRKLKHITGRSTKELMIDYRLQKAAMHIKSKSFNVTETMYAVGFSSLSAFSKSFKNKFGVSPGKYGNSEN